MVTNVGICAYLST